jgi:hypothetical protein
MAILSDSDREAVRQNLAELPGTVRLVHFTQSLACESCPQARQLIEEVAQLSDRVELQVLNLQVHGDEALRLGVDRVPATVVLGEREARIVYYGLPVGYEFATLLHTMHRVASGDSGLEPASRQRLSTVTDPLHLQVFVTPG